MRGDGGYPRVLRRLMTGKLAKLQIGLNLTGTLAPPFTLTLRRNRCEKLWNMRLPGLC